MCVCWGQGGDCLSASCTSVRGSCQDSPSSSTWVLRFSLSQTRRMSGVPQLICCLGSLPLLYYAHPGEIPFVCLYSTQKQTVRRCELSDSSFPWNLPRLYGGLSCSEPCLALPSRLTAFSFQVAQGMVRLPCLRSNAALSTPCIQNNKTPGYPAYRYSHYQTDLTGASGTL